jgi:uncharacterized membrane protein
MNGTDRRAALGRPILMHPIFIGPGATLLIAALVTDIFYSQTALIQWSNFSTWLILGGLLLALLAAILLVIDIALGHTGPISWLDFILLSVAVILSIFNELVHTRDAWTTVVPTGITLSVIVTILLVIARFRGWSLTAVRNSGRGERR